LSSFLRPNASQVGIPDAALRLLRDLISERAAVHFEDNKLDLLADKLTELVTAQGVPSFLDYYYLLRYDSDADRHWARLMDRLSVPETYFWRQAEQFEALAQHIAPEFFSRRPTRPLRIWSAACCTGEEPISITMALAETGLLTPGRVEIIASDASEAMLARARAGLYRERSFRQLPAVLREKYFTREDEAWRPKDCLVRPITWHRANLAQVDEWARFASADAIFCRNVFIYFSDAAVKRIGAAIAERMPPGGHLFLGASESLARYGLPLDLLEVARSFVYVKGSQRALAESEAADSASGAWPPPSRPVR